MRSLAVVAVVIVIAGGQTPQAPQPATPRDCVKAGQEFAAKKQKEAGRLTSAIAREIDAQRIEMVKACGAGMDYAKADPAQMPGFVEFYLAAQQPDLAEQALDRGLAADTNVANRAALLNLAVRMLLRQPKSDARNQRAEAYVDELDRLPEEAREQQAAAHAAMNNYYRGDDIDSGIIRHSTWLIDAGKKMTPEQRKRLGWSFVYAYTNLAEALAGQGQTDDAIALLKRAFVECADLPNVESYLGGTLERYQLVGTPAAPLTPPAWLNRDAAAGPMDLKGRVTLLQFTAHWCGPCKESYPGMQRLRQRFKEQPFQVVFATRTYGYFGSDRDLTREQEIERDRGYFASYGFDIPIAVGPAASEIVDGRTVRRDDPAETAYKVAGIPQIMLIDRAGVIRLIMIGYDDANEPKLAERIEALLAAK